MHRNKYTSRYAPQVHSMALDSSCKHPAYLGQSSLQFSDVLLITSLAETENDAPTDYPGPEQHLAPLLSYAQ